MAIGMGVDALFFQFYLRRADSSHPISMRNGILFQELRSPIRSLKIPSHSAGDMETASPPFMSPNSSRLLLMHRLRRFLRISTVILIRLPTCRMMLRTLHMGFVDLRMFLLSVLAGNEIFFL